jgi:hypothetical protein
MVPMMVQEHLFDFAKPANMVGPACRAPPPRAHARPARRPRLPPDPDRLRGPASGRTRADRLRGPASGRTRAAGRGAQGQQDQSGAVPAARRAVPRRHFRTWWRRGKRRSMANVMALEPFDPSLTLSPHPTRPPPERVRCVASYGMMSSVLPGFFMRGINTARARFPSFFGLRSPSGPPPN